MKDTYIFAVESSCDETSASIIKNGHEEIATTVLTQMDIHALYGGVVPEIASRKHIENVTMVFEETFKKSGLTINDMDAVAITYGPGLIGSLLVGVEAAKTLAYAHNKPIVPVHHIAGHIYANNLEKNMEFPLIALVVSGGHTELIYMKEDYSFEKIGGTLDDAVGEAYDKVARLIGLPYPGGPKLDKLAQEGNPHAFKLPEAKVDGYNFSFSGLKTAVLRLVKSFDGQELPTADICASFQECVSSTLLKKVKRAAEERGYKQVVLAGGVAANSEIRKKIFDLKDDGYNVFAPIMKYCTDNASMVASAAFFFDKTFDNIDVEVFSRVK